MITGCLQILLPQTIVTLGTIHSMKTHTHARNIGSNLTPTVGRKQKSLADNKYISAGSTPIPQRGNGSLVSSLQHISSRRHKDRAAGKPAKQKYSPYTKTQKGPTKQPVSLQPCVTSYLVTRVLTFAPSLSQVLLETDTSICDR